LASFSLGRMYYTTKDLNTDLATTLSISLSSW